MNITSILGHKSTENHLSFWGKNLLKITSILGKKSFESQLLSNARNLLKITTIVGKISLFSRLKITWNYCTENELIYQKSNTLIFDRFIVQKTAKIGSFSILENYWKWDRFLEKKSSKNRLVFCLTIFCWE